MQIGKYKIIFVEIAFLQFKQKEIFKLLTFPSYFYCIILNI